MLSELQQAEFETAGILRLAGAFSEMAARSMREQLWRSFADRYGMRPDEAATWTVRQPTGFQALTRSGVFHAVAGEALTQALDQLLGRRWERLKHWGAPLVTFPDRSGAWQVPHQHWHLDFPARGPSFPLPGIRVLAFVSPVLPRGGGTLVQAGSQMLVSRLVLDHSVGGHSTEVRHALAQRYEWLRTLWSGGGGSDRIRRFMVEGAVIDGVSLRVIELTGNPGDIVLLHPWALHAPAPNCGATPRIMVSHSVFCTKERGRPIWT